MVIGMKENKKDQDNEKWKIWVDIALLPFFLSCLPMFFWCVKHTECSAVGSHHPIGTIMLIDVIPFIFGFIWFSLRYPKIFFADAKTVGTIFISNLKFLIVIIIICLIASIF